MMPSPENATVENSAKRRKFELLSETELNLIAAALVSTATNHQSRANELLNANLNFSSTIYVRGIIRVELILAEVNEEFGFRELANGARK